MTQPDAEPAQPYGPPYTQQYPGDYQPAPYGAYAPRPPMPKNDLGVLALVLGVVATCLGFFMAILGVAAGIPAVIVGSKAKAAVRQGLADNEGSATAGIV